MFHKNRRHRFVAIILAVSYGLGGPITAVLEYREAFFSERFDLPPELLYATIVVQFICSIGILSKRFAQWAALCLTVTTIGAIYAHFRIGSPTTSLVAFAYSGLQIWFWYSLRSVD